MNLPKLPTFNFSLKKFTKVQKIILVLVIIGLVVFLVRDTNIFAPKIAPERDCSKVVKSDNAVVIKMENNQFDPNDLTAKVCDTLLFLNLDAATKWPMVGPESADKIYPGFDAGHELGKYDYFEFQVTRPGTYSFYDHMHPKISGKIIIQDQK